MLRHWLTPQRRPDGRGRPWRDARAVLNGILWICAASIPSTTRRTITRRTKSAAAFFNNDCAMALRSDFCKHSPKRRGRAGNWELERFALIHDK